MQDEKGREWSGPSRARTRRVYRSKSDSEIRYCVGEEPPEAAGTANYINREGGLSKIVLLKAVAGVSRRPEACSLRVCEVLLNILHLLVDIGMLRPEKNLEERSSRRKDRAQDNLQLFLSSVVRFGMPPVVSGCFDGEWEDVRACL
ncbi:unnamed protein product [Darwinula stevensoni]|uniref:Uncharacterized protein n=1 Tax=Darwinula stevensoni TaxID=69355 RepID=A0A7R9AJU0_9CRUS|nr:unnamed protein product [Darwinula stevensoni]CAG0908988.1 unnamed protein product [Darwinula stevensoni]